MKKLICQVWRTLTDEEHGLVKSTYSLHLNEKSRIQYIHKNLRKMQANGAVDTKTHFSCEIEDDVYEKVLKSQIKHGLMFEREAPSKPSEKNYATWITSKQATDVWHNVTIQFQEISNVIKKMEIVQDEGGFQILEDIIEELDSDPSD